MDDNISIDVLSLNSDHEDTDDDGDEPTTQATYDGSSLYKLLKPKLNAKITNDKVELIIKISSIIFKFEFFLERNQHTTPGANRGGQVYIHQCLC